MKAGSSNRVTVHIYTDGACEGNPGSGGWAALLQRDGNTKELSGGELETTNNRMELQAAVRALQSLQRPYSVHLHTDSKYLRLGMTEWLPTWISHGWLTAQHRPVKNRDLWEELHRLARIHEIEWHWVKAHAGNPLNERVDALARQAIRRGPVEAPSERATEIYVKASCRGARGSGGWAVVCVRGGRSRERSGAESDTTANRMEIRAAIEGLRSCRRDPLVRVQTSSRYLYDGVTRWMVDWARRAWKTQAGRPVRNQDLWAELNRLTGNREVHWHLLGKTKRPPEAERAATLARGAAQRGKARK